MMGECLSDISLMFDYSAESFKYDGVPILDGFFEFIEFEFMFVVDFISNARVGNLIEVFYQG